ncbi:MAG: dUTP diphosphatase [Ruminiclostridium sp.]
MFIKVKKLNDKAKLPERATELSAGADIYACIDNDITLNPGERKLIATGFALAVPAGYGGFVFPRSGLSSKHGVSLSNCVGVIDSDYRGELKVPMIHHGTEPYVIKNGERIAQLVIMPIDTSEFVFCDELDDTQRGEGGFGSTGNM